MDTFRIGGGSPYSGGGLDQLQQPPQQSQQQQQGLLPSTSMAAATAVAATPARVAGGNVAAHTTVHVTATAEVDPFDEKRLEEIRKTLLMLEDIAQGRHIINWKELVDPSQPMESAKKISAALARPTTLPAAVSGVAECITTPAHLSIVACLEPPYWAKVRDAVLHDLLNTLTTARDPHPMPACSEMLAEMVRLNLVVLRGVATTLEALLSDASTRRAAVAVLGKLADQHRGDEVFLRAVQNVEPLVRAIQEPEYEYDCVAIARLLGWGGADKAAALVPVRTLEQPCLVTSMAYFRQRDELASATCDGSVVVWGSPHPSTGEVRPATTVELPQRCVPVAMDGASRGNYLVVAGMPFPASSISAIAGENSATGSSGNSNSSSNNNSKRRSLSSGTSKGPLLRLLTCNESTGAWTNGETITRKENVTLTAVAALANLVVCTAESAPSERSPETGLQHDLVLLNGHTTQTMRRFERVHDDYTTIVRVGEDSDHALFTGSRDCVVKVWDTRSSSNRPSLSTAAAVSAATTAGMGASLPRVENAHTDTITAVVPHRKALLTASLDGSLLVWDARRMNAPVHNVHMSAGILDVAPVDGAHVAVSTARGLYLLSLETLNTLDAVPNVTHTQLKASGDGSVIFAAGGNGIGVYALRK